MSTSEFDERRAFLRYARNSGLLAWAAASGLLPHLVHAIGQVPGRMPTGRSIYDLRGSVVVDGRKADEHTPVFTSSTVETGSDSYVIFAVGDDSHILRENSRMELGGDSALVRFMRLVTGKLLSVFGQRSQQNQLAVRTSTATIGIRGTGVYTESESDHSYVCTCYGQVTLQSINDESSQEQIESFHHDAPRYILADGNAGRLIEPAPVKNHTDEELMLIEELMGRTPPFSSVEGYSSPRRGY